MIKTQVFCDFCERPIPYKINADHQDCSIDIELHKPKEFDTSYLYPHMCESCAKKIDEILVAYRAEIIHHAELGAKFAKVNAERKERLGTKG